MNRIFSSGPGRSPHPDAGSRPRRTQDGDKLVQVAEIFEPRDQFDDPVDIALSQHRRRDLPELVFDFVAPERIFGAATPVEDFVVQRAAVARMYRDASRVTIRGSHGIDLRIDISLHAPDEIEQARIT